MSPLIGPRWFLKEHRDPPCGWVAFPNRGHGHPWQYATDDRFTGRWDDPDGVWRTLYVGYTRLACYLEVLAAFRADPELAHQLHDIDEDPADIDAFPTTATGALSTRWREPRLIGSATLTGWYILPADKQSLPTLRARFLSLAVHHRLPDLDAAAIRLAEPRALTQAIAGWAYEQAAPGGVLIAGVHFDSHTAAVSTSEHCSNALVTAASPHTSPA